MARRPSRAGFGVPRDRQRWPSYDRVYQRRRPPRRARPSSVAEADAAAGDVDPVAPMSAEDGCSEQPLQVVLAEDVGRSDVMEEMIGGGRIRINVSAWSKIERRGLRRRLAEELERVRCFMAGIEPEVEVDVLDETPFPLPLALPEVVEGLEECDEFMATPADQEETFGLGTAQPLEKLAILPYNSNYDSNFDLEAAYPDERMANAADEQFVDLTTAADNDMPRTALLYRPQITIPDGEMKLADAEVGTPVLEKEKRTPKADLFYPNSDYVSGKKKIFSNGGSHLKPRSNGRGRPRLPRDKMAANAFKVGMGLVQKMISSKNGWIFDKPVDVLALGLFDYYDIIKHPMDLGTVKSKLDNDEYNTPDEFAADVRLTFQNAMKYNADHHEVHLMAKQLLNTFEGKWATVEFEYARRNLQESGLGVGPPTYMMTTNMPQALPPEPRTLDGSRSAFSFPVENEVPEPRTLDGSRSASSFPVENEVSEPTTLDGSRSASSFPVENEVPEPRTLDGSRSAFFPVENEVSEHRTSDGFRPAFSFPAEIEVPEVRTFMPPQNKVPQLTLKIVENNVPEVLRPVKRSFAGKKPKAGDLNKREMSGQEKRKLIWDLEKLPHEKQDHVIQVLKRRKAEYESVGDAYSIDVYSFDVETLWELDRLISNYKKSYSKLKRRAELAQAKREAMTPRAVSLSDPNIVNGEAQEEIIEDGEGVSRSLPAEVENNGGVESGYTTSSSSSSDDSSSSSSDSDSGSSSSDSDGRHSPSTRTGD